jgi:hypothetical protein
MHRSTPFSRDLGHSRRLDYRTTSSEACAGVKGGPFIGPVLQLDEKGGYLQSLYQTVTAGEVSP